MSTDDEEGEENVEEAACPYCRSMDACAHLLLVVDITFRSAGGGVLYEAFEKRLVDSFENGPDDGGDIAFDELIEEVEGLADAEDGYVIDSPGMSSAYRAFYASTLTKAESVLALFGRPVAGVARSTRTGREVP